MFKKGQGISMNVIIIAAIALLVLVILSVLVLNAGGKIGTGTNCAGVQNSECADSIAGCRDGFIRDITKSCTDKTRVCCIPSPI
ncbi:MAG: hypothetical protein ABIC91_01390 [Nanoarchaeota archaeon]|nr:hypothetical protein [Nanoarchaeota archaeon]MBU1029865.1 hypothetical protein [Nanoarchaeota archaeon]MBU1849285.1 hypothetical protein [Nanoarchaeota archaeon]